LDDPNKLLLVANGLTGSELQQYRVPMSAKFQQSLGGTRMSLNARVAKRIIELAPSHRWNAPDVHRLLSDELGALRALPVYDRETMTDSEVVAFITGTIATQGPLPQSRLLRQLRDQNKACEQKRFARLYFGTLEGAV